MFSWCKNGPGTDGATHGVLSDFRTAHQIIDTPVSEVAQVQLTILFMHQVELLSHLGYCHLPRFPQPQSICDIVTFSFLCLRLLATSTGSPWLSSPGSLESFPFSAWRAGEAFLQSPGFLHSFLGWSIPLVIGSLLFTLFSILPDKIQMSLVPLTQTFQ